MSVAFSREPAVWISVIGALLTVAVAFGLKLSPEQKTAVDALLTVIVGLIIRSQVTPV